MLDPAQTLAAVTAGAEQDPAGYAFGELGAFDELGGGVVGVARTVYEDFPCRPVASKDPGLLRRARPRWKRERYGPEGVSPVATWSASHHTDVTRPMVLIVLAIGGLVAAFWTLFMAGEILTDPGGWLGLALVCVWLLPMLGLSALALLRPSWAAPVLVALVGLWVAGSALTVVYAESWRQFEDTHGPVSLIVLVALCVPLLALGRDRSLLAGVLLLVAVATPILAGVFWVIGGAGLGGTLALAVIATPFVVLGAVLVAIGVLDRRAQARVGPPDGQQGP